MRVVDKMDNSVPVRTLKEAQLAVITTWETDTSVLGKVVTRWGNDLILLGEGRSKSYSTFFTKDESITAKDNANYRVKLLEHGTILEV